MDPKTAVNELRGRGWSDKAIGANVGIDRSMVCRVRLGDREPTWRIGDRLIALAKSKRKPK